MSGIDDWEVLTPNDEGLRVRCHSSEENGLFLLRMSLHDPEMPLNIESNVVGDVKAIASRLQKLFKEYTHIQTDSMRL